MSEALLDILKEQISPEVVRGMAQQVGADEAETGQAVSALLPMLVGGLSKNTHNDREGMRSLSRALERDHDGGTLEHLSKLLAAAGGAESESPLAGLVQNASGKAAQSMLSGLLGGQQKGAAALLSNALGGGKGQASADMLSGLLGGQGADTLGLLLGSAPTGTRGSNVAGMLGHILGGQTSGVQQGVAKALGLDAGKVGGLMALLAPMVLGALGKAKRQQGLDPQGLANLLDRERKTLEERTPELKQGGLLELLGQNGNTDQLMSVGAALAKNMLFAG